MPYDIPILPLELKPRERGTGVPAEKLETWIEKNVTPLVEEAYPTKRSIHQATVRLAWQFYYSTRGASDIERSSLTGTFLDAMDALHNRWLDVEKVDLVEERIVYAPPPPQYRTDPQASLPRDPEQAALRFDEV